MSPKQSKKICPPSTREFVGPLNFRSDIIIESIWADYRDTYMIETNDCDREWRQSAIYTHERAP